MSTPAAHVEVSICCLTFLPSCPPSHLPVGRARLQGCRAQLPTCTRPSTACCLTLCPSCLHTILPPHPGRDCYGAGPDRRSALLCLACSCKPVASPSPFLPSSHLPVGRARLRQCRVCRAPLPMSTRAPFVLAPLPLPSSAHAASCLPS